MKQRLSIGFVSLGCPKNLVDSEMMMSALSDEGFRITGEEGDADVIVINTCGFLEPAKNESLQTIGEYTEKKTRGGLKAVLVAGCMTERYLELMQKEYPQVDGFIRTGEFSKVREMVCALEGQDESFLKQRRELLGEAPKLQGHSEMKDQVKRMAWKRPYAYVKISEGCNRRCSFCIIPKLRGKHHSRSIEGIVDELKQLSNQGTKEVIFIAQDLTSYGRDLKDGTNLAKLLQEVENIEGIEWYRLMYNYPRFFTDELLEQLRNSDKFTGYLDIPFQHISDPILKHMKRPESSEEIYKLIERLRESLPDLSLRTTLMVGFPGESEADFEKLMSFVEKAQFDHMGAFPYYREQNTPSFDLEGQVEESVKQDRYQRLMALQEKLQEKNLRKKIGREENCMIDAFVEQNQDGTWLYTGRSWAQAPEIDGITYIVSEVPLTAGEMVSVEMQKRIGSHDLLGVAVPSLQAEVAQR